MADIPSTPKISSLTDRFGNNFFFGNAGDYWHPCFPIGADSDYRTHVRNIRDMEIRPDDVIISSFPKSGVHWHEEIIKQLMTKTAQVTHSSGDFHGFLDLFPPAKIANMPSPRILLTHVPFRYFPKQALEKKVKIIRLDRNPKDVIVSFYNFMQNHKPPLFYPGTFEHFFYLSMEVGYYYGDLFDYLMDWQRGREAHPDVDILTSVFEDMKLDPSNGVKRLNKYLGTGCSDELCHQIAHTTSFKAMKGYKDATVSEQFKQMFEENRFSMYRKGDVGDWQNWFTDAMNEEFDEEYKKRMSDYKIKHKFIL